MDEDTWKAEPIGMRAFWQDPENNPLATPTGKIEFYATGIANCWGDEADFADELANAERLDPKSNVYYLNLPKRWVAGQVVDPETREVIIGATVTMQEEGNDAAEVFKTTSDDFGDFWFRQVEGKKHHLWFEAEGYVTRELTADATEADNNIGNVGMYKMIPLG